MKTISNQFVAGTQFGLALSMGGIGPVTLLIFSLASILPLSVSLSGVLGAVLVNIIYISLSIAGISKLIIKQPNFKKLFGTISSIILIALGIFFMWNSFSEFEQINIITQSNSHIQTFWSLFLITIMNPMTIIMFTSVFSQKSMTKNISKKQL